MYQHEISLEVRQSDSDKLGITSSTNYLSWFEFARTNYMNNLGCDVLEYDRAGYETPIIDLKLTYKQNIVIGEIIKIVTWIEKYNSLRISFAYEVYKQNGELALTALTEQIVVTKFSQQLRPVRIDRVFPNRDEIYKENLKNNYGGI